MEQKIAEEQAAAGAGSPRCGWRCRALIAVSVMLVTALIAVEWVAHDVEPMLKARVVRTLEARFQSRVELSGFQVSVLNGLEAQGTGLKIFPRGESGAAPIFVISQFSFHTRWIDLLRTPMRVRVVHIRDLGIHLPPKGQRRLMPRLEGKQEEQAESILVDELEVQRAELTLGANKPGKIPLVFKIVKLTMQRVGANQPMKFQALLVNPKPVGQIKTRGVFGPFDEGAAGDTPVKGTYHFDSVDLSTINGIGGTLTSTGRFSGQLNRIEVDGETRTPNFRISSVQHPVRLNTTFHAIVNGTNGNTYLQPVDATLGNSHLVARGEVVRGADGHGHAVRLNVAADHAQIQDFLALAVKAEPAFMSGAVKLRVIFHLPPGKAAVLDKLHLKGSFAIANAKFSNRKIQTDVDRLSLRAQGKPKQARALHRKQEEGRKTDAGKIASQIRGEFVLANAQLRFSRVEYQLPGAWIGLTGTYSLSQKTLDLHGEVRTRAEASQMTTGWKSFMLKAVNPLLKKQGAGMQVPIQITGTQSKPKIGLDFKHRHRDAQVHEAQR